MKCPSCAAEIPAGSRFCNDCGAAVPTQCRACGHVNARGSRFCSECGARLTAAGPSSLRAPWSAEVAERRHMTVMVADLVGSSALSTKLDQEDLLEIMAAYYELVQREVDRFGGFIARHIGDGVLVCFGYPSAHEDDAERAVRAGLAIAANIGSLDTRLGIKLEVRVGIATGLVIIDPVNRGGTVERTIYGEAPNLASGLQSVTEPGKVVIDPFTFRLVRTKFDCRDLGCKEIKGLGPTSVREVERERSYGSRIAAGPAPRAPLVGRRDEVELMLRGWQQAKAGQGCAIVLSGEPGIGKSRLAEALLDAVGREAPVVQRYYGSAIHQESAFFPVIAQLQYAAGFEVDDTPDMQIGKLERLLARGSKNRPNDLALLAELFSIDGGRCPRLPLTSRRRMEETFSALLGQIAGAGDQPGVIVFEDAHWLDPSSLELLERLVERVPTGPALLVVTARPEFRPDWIGQPQVAFLPLKGLGAHDCVSLIEELTTGRGVPEEVKRQIADRTDGVPLFVEELTRAVLESGALHDDPDGSALRGPTLSLAIPTTLQASLLARLDRLNIVRDIAQEAAAIGREFAYDLLAAVTRRDEAELVNGLEQLVAAGLLLQQGMPPRGSYSFKHALVQDVAYGTLLRSRREALHARIAEVYERQFPDLVETRPELLAHHLEQAGLFERAVDAWFRAAQMTAERGAMAASVAQLRRGLALIEHVTDARTRRILELKLRTSLGGTLMALKGYTGSETDAAFRRARELCTHLGDTAQLMRVIWGQFTNRFAGGFLAQALAEAEELLQLAERLGDIAGQQVGCASVGASLLHLGRFAEARERLEAAVEIQPPDPRRAALLYGQSGRVTALSYLSLALLLLGFPDRSRQIGAEALETARSLQHPTSLCFAHSVVCRVDFLRRDADAMAEGAQAVVGLAAKHELKLWQALGSIYSGWVALEAGAVEDAIASIRGGIGQYRAVGAGLSLPLYLAGLAEAERRAGKAGTAVELLEEAEAAISAGGEHWVAPEIHRQRGEAVLALGSDDARAETELRAALALAREQGSPHWELRAVQSLARWRATPDEPLGGERDGRACPQRTGLPQA